LFAPGAILAQRPRPSGCRGLLVSGSGGGFPAGVPIRSRPGGALPRGEGCSARAGGGSRGPEGGNSGTNCSLLECQNVGEEDRASSHAPRGPGGRGTGDCLET